MLRAMRELTTDQVNDREAAEAGGCLCGWSVDGSRVTNPHVTPRQYACPYHNWSIDGDRIVAMRRIHA